MPKKSERTQLLEFFTVKDNAGPLLARPEMVPERPRRVPTSRAIAARIRRPSNTVIIWFILAVLFISWVPARRFRSHDSASVHTPTFQGDLGSLRPADDWGRTILKPGIEGLSGVGANAFLEGLVQIRIHQNELGCIEMVSEVSGLVPYCPDPASCEPTSSGVQWTAKNTRRFDPVEASSGSTRPLSASEMLLYYTPNNADFYPFLRLPGSWSAARRGRFLLHGSRRMSVHLSPWLSGFLQLLSVEPARLAAALVVPSIPSSAVAAMFQQREESRPVKQLKFPQQASACFASGIAEKSQLPKGAVAETNTTASGVQQERALGDSPLSQLSFSAQLRPVLPGALVSSNFSLIPGGGIHGSATLDALHKTQELLLEVEAAGSVFFNLEDTVEHEFNPPCGAECEEHPTLPVSPTALILFASQDRVVYQHVMSFKGRWIREEARQLHPQLQLNRPHYLFRCRSRQAVPKELLSGSKGVQEVLLRSHLALGIAVETPGTVPGRNLFAGILQRNDGREKLA